MNPIDRTRKSEITGNRVGYIILSKMSLNRTLNEVEFKKELCKLVVPIYIIPDVNHLGVEKWLCYSHNLFREVEPEEEIPTYEVKVAQLDDGKIIITGIKEVK